MNNNVFERCWSKFAITVKKRLIEKSKTQKITLNYANLILNDAILMWEDPSEECGIWLSHYAKSVPDKGGLIKNIITNNVKFYAIKERKDFPEILKILIPVIGAVAGFAISYVLKAPIWGKIVSSIAPAVILFPLMNIIQKNKNASNVKADIKDYLTQLDNYKNSITDVLTKM